MSAFGWDLPPGCTNKDIDDAFGEPPMKECPTCCGGCDVPADEIEDVELTWWQKIKNFFTPVWIVCPTCNGDGEVEMTEEDFRADQEMYDYNERDLD